MKKERERESKVKCKMKIGSGNYFKGKNAKGVKPSFLLLRAFCVAAAIAMAFCGRKDVYARSEGEFEYCYVSYYGGAEIIGYTGDGVEVEIPESLGEYKVVSISDDVFNGYSSLKTIKLPSGIVKIYPGNFENCENLTDIQVAQGNPYFWSKDGVLYMEQNLFRCPQGKSGSIALSEDVTGIAYRAFFGCDKIESVRLSAAVEGSECSGGSFAYCENLRKIEVEGGNPDFISEDGFLLKKDEKGRTLVSCPGAKSGALTLPDNIHTIDYNAFSGCGKIESVTLPQTVETIEANAFEDCGKLEKIEVEAGNPFFHARGGILYNKEGTKLIRCPAGKSGDIAISGSVTEIAGDAFASAKKVETITLPSGVEKVYSGSFKDCDSLKAIHIDAQNPYLKSEDGIVYSKDGTELICYPPGKAQIVSVPTGVRVIGEYAFEYCKNIKEIELPQGVEEIGHGAFSGCSGLSAIKFPEGVTQIGDFAFESCSSLTSAELPEGIKNISAGLFNYCKNLRWISIPKSVVYIEIGTLFSAANYSLKDVYYAGGRKQWNQIELDVPLSLPVFYDDAAIHFSDHTVATGKELNSEYGQTDGGGKKGEAYPSGKNLYRVTGADTVTIVDTSSKGQVAIPDTVTINGKTYQVTAVTANAFHGNKKITKIVIGKNVKTIGKCAFKGCKSLKDITIKGKNLKKVGKNAFQGIDPYAVVKAPAKKYNEYRKLLKKKGFGRYVRITKA